MQSQHSCGRGRQASAQHRLLSIINAQLVQSLVMVQACRQGGFEGVRSNPPFGPQKILYIHCYSTFSALPVH